MDGRGKLLDVAKARVVQDNATATRAIGPPLGKMKWL